MNEIKTIDEAIKYLSKKAGIKTEIVKYKYRVYDNDFNNSIKNDEELIIYAKEQKESLESEEVEK